MDLTPKQRAVLQYLKDYRREHGMPPSYDEIRREFGFASLNSARKHLLQLHRKGFIRSPWKNQKRALEIVESTEQPRAAALSVVGMVTAGKGIQSEEAPATAEIPDWMLRSGEHFALRARGEGMVDDGIQDGDLLVVQSREDPEPGQTVVALVNGEAAVKRYYREGERVELRGASERSPGLAADSSAVELRGVVVGLLRTYP